MSYEEVKAEVKPNPNDPRTHESDPPPVFLVEHCDSWLKLKMFLFGVLVTFMLMLFMWISKRALDDWAAREAKKSTLGEKPSGIIVRTFKTVDGDVYKCKGWEIYTCGLHLFACEDKGERFCVMDAYLEPLKL